MENENTTNVKKLSSLRDFKTKKSRKRKNKNSAEDYVVYLYPDFSIKKSRGLSSFVYSEANSIW